MTNSGDNRSFRPWWQTCPIDEFEDRVASMSLRELEEMAVDVKAAAASIAATIESTPDADRRSRAKYASRMVADRRRRLTQAIHARNQDATAWKAKRRAAIDRGRAQLDNGDLAGAVSTVLDWMAQWQ